MKQINGVLEIDTERGVIYFTANPPPLKEIPREPYFPWLRMRICQLPTPIPDNIESIDIAADTKLTSYQT